MSNKVYRLHEWSVQSDNDPYTAPECRSIQLVGYRDYEDRKVITSRVEEVNGRTIKTHSGSTYILEDIDNEYLAWLAENGMTYDPENPIKVKQ